MISFFWDNLLVNPMTNALIALDHLLFGNFGLAILAFTIVVRALTFPLTMRQLHSTRAMSELQPQIKEIQKKYKDPKRRNQETMRLYKEGKVNPLGCLLPMLIQFPVWIALYQVIRLTLAGAPENYVDLSQRLYSFAYIQHAVPVGNTFLWLDLGQPDTVLPIFVGLSMWVQQRSMTLTNAATSPQQRQMNNTMLWMMPVMFGWFSLTVPSGLALYWLATNLVGIIMNGFVFGFSTLHPAKLFSFLPFRRSPGTTVAPHRTPALNAVQSQVTAEDGDTETRTSNGAGTRNKRKNRRRGSGRGAPPARPKS